MLSVAVDAPGRFSFVQVDDAVAATARALDRGAPGVYNIVDDDPAPAREWIPALAAALVAPAPGRVDGPGAGRTVDQRGACNAKARRELGWEPRHRSWREGFCANGG